MTALGVHARLAKAPMLPRDEMAFRKPYRDLLLRRALTTVFRPGDRIYPSWRGYLLGEVVCARIIERPGSDELGIPPRFEELRIAIRIADLWRGPLEALQPDAFAGSSPDVSDRHGLRAHLHAIYGRPLGDFGDVVTRIAFAYVD